MLSVRRAGLFGVEANPFMSSGVAVVVVGRAGRSGAGTLDFQEPQPVRSDRGGACIASYPQGGGGGERLRPSVNVQSAVASSSPTAAPLRGGGAGPPPPPLSSPPPSPRPSLPPSSPPPLPPVRAHSKHVADDGRNGREQEEDDCTRATGFAEVEEVGGRDQRLLQNERLVASSIVEEDEERFLPSSGRRRSVSASSGLLECEAGVGGGDGGSLRDIPTPETTDVGSFKLLSSPGSREEVTQEVYEVIQFANVLTITSPPSVVGLNGSFREAFPQQQEPPSSPLPHQNDGSLLSVPPISPTRHGEEPASAGTAAIPTLGLRNLMGMKRTLSAATSSASTATAPRATRSRSVGNDGVSTASSSSSSGNGCCVYQQPHQQQEQVAFPRLSALSDLPEHGAKSLVIVTEGKALLGHVADGLEEEWTSPVAGTVAAAAALVEVRSRRPRRPSSSSSSGSSAIVSANTTSVAPIFATASSNLQQQHSPQVVCNDLPHHRRGAAWDDSDRREFRSTVVAPVGKQLHQRQEEEVNEEGIQFCIVDLREGDFQLIVGRRIRVYWPLDEKWYNGEVRSYNPARKVHKVVYDDNDEEWLRLKKELFKIQVLPGDTFSSGAKSALSCPSTTGPCSQAKGVSATGAGAGDPRGAPITSCLITTPLRGGGLTTPPPAYPLPPLKSSPSSSLPTPVSQPNAKPVYTALDENRGDRSAIAGDCAVIRGQDSPAGSELLAEEFLGDRVREEENSRLIASSRERVAAVSSVEEDESSRLRPLKLPEIGGVEGAENLVVDDCFGRRGSRLVSQGGRRTATSSVQPPGEGFQVSFRSANGGGGEGATWDAHVAESSGDHRERTRVEYDGSKKGGVARVAIVGYDGSDGGSRGRVWIDGGRKGVDMEAAAMEDKGSEPDDRGKNDRTRLTRDNASRLSHGGGLPGASAVEEGFRSEHYRVSSNIYVRNCPMAEDWAEKDGVDAVVMTANDGGIYERKEDVKHANWNTHNGSSSISADHALEPRTPAADGYNADPGCDWSRCPMEEGDDDADTKGPTETPADMAGCSPRAAVVGSFSNNQGTQRATAQANGRGRVVAEGEVAGGVGEGGDADAADAAAAAAAGSLSPRGAMLLGDPECGSMSVSPSTTTTMVSLFAERLGQEVDKNNRQWGSPWEAGNGNATPCAAMYRVAEGSGKRDEERRSPGFVGGVTIAAAASPYPRSPLDAVAFSHDVADSAVVVAFADGETRPGSQRMTGDGSERGGGDGDRGTAFCPPMSPTAPPENGAETSHVAATAMVDSAGAGSLKRGRDLAILGPPCSSQSIQQHEDLVEGVHSGLLPSMVLEGGVNGRKGGKGGGMTAAEDSYENVEAEMIPYRGSSPGECDDAGSDRDRDTTTCSRMRRGGVFTPEEEGGTMMVGSVARGAVGPSQVYCPGMAVAVSVRLPGEMGVNGSGVGLDECSAAAKGSLEKGEGVLVPAGSLPLKRARGERQQKRKEEGEDESLSPRGGGARKLTAVEAVAGCAATLHGDRSEGAIHVRRGKRSVKSVGGRFPRVVQSNPNVRPHNSVLSNGAVASKERATSSTGMGDGLLTLCASALVPTSGVTSRNHDVTVDRTAAAGKAAERGRSRTTHQPAGGMAAKRGGGTGLSSSRMRGAGAGGVEGAVMENSSGARVRGTGLVASMTSGVGGAASSAGVDAVESGVRRMHVLKLRRCPENGGLWRVAGEYASGSTTMVTSKSRPSPPAAVSEANALPVGQQANSGVERNARGGAATLERADEVVKEKKTKAQSGLPRPPTFCSATASAGSGALPRREGEVTTPNARGPGAICGRPVLGAPPLPKDVSGSRKEGGLKSVHKSALGLPPVAVRQGSGGREAAQQPSCKAQGQGQGQVSSIRKGARTLRPEESFAQQRAGGGSGLGGGGGGENRGLRMTKVTSAGGGARGGSGLGGGGGGGGGGGENRGLTTAKVISAGGSARVDLRHRTGRKGVVGGGSSGVEKQASATTAWSAGDAKKGGARQEMWCREPGGEPVPVRRLESSSLCQPDRAQERNEPSFSKMEACRCNVLVIEDDFGRREEGAEVHLDLDESGVWVLVVVLQGKVLYTAKAEHMSATGTVNRYTHAMIWKADRSWMLEFDDRKEWQSFKESHEECYQRNIRVTSTRQIPVPGVREVPDYGASRCGLRFFRPSNRYIQQKGGGEADLGALNSRVIYDLDSEDEEWLEKVYPSLAGGEGTSGSGRLTDEEMERIMDVLEKGSVTLNREVPVETACVYCSDIAPREVVEAVHEHWVARRQKKGMALLRHFQPPAWVIYQEQLKSWQRQEMQQSSAKWSGKGKSAQKHSGRPPSKVSLMRPPLFAFCLKPRGLEQRPRQRTNKRQGMLSSQGMEAVTEGLQGRSLAADFKAVAGCRRAGDQPPLKRQKQEALPVKRRSKPCIPPDSRPWDALASQEPATPSSSNGVLMSRVSKPAVVWATSAPQGAMQATLSTSAPGDKKLKGKRATKMKRRMNVVAIAEARKKQKFESQSATPGQQSASRSLQMHGDASCEELTCKSSVEEQQVQGAQQRNGLKDVGEKEGRQSVFAQGGGSYGGLRRGSIEQEMKAGAKEVVRGVVPVVKQEGKTPFVQCKAADGRVAPVQSQLSHWPLRELKGVNSRCNAISGSVHRLEDVALTRDQMEALAQVGDSMLGDKRQQEDYGEATQKSDDMSKEARQGDRGFCQQADHENIPPFQEREQNKKSDVLQEDLPCERGGECIISTKLSVGNGSLSGESCGVLNGRGNCHRNGFLGMQDQNEGAKEQQVEEKAGLRTKELLHPLLEEDVCWQGADEAGNQDANLADAQQMQDQLDQQQRERDLHCEEPSSALSPPKESHLGVLSTESQLFPYSLSPLMGSCPTGVTLESLSALPVEFSFPPFHLSASSLALPPPQLLVAPIGLTLATGVSFPNEILGDKATEGAVGVLKDSNADVAQIEFAKLDAAAWKARSVAFKERARADQLKELAKEAKTKAMEALQKAEALAGTDRPALVAELASLRARLKPLLEASESLGEEAMGGGSQTHLKTSKRERSKGHRQMRTERAGDSVMASAGKGPGSGAGSHPALPSCGSWRRAAPKQGVSGLRGIRGGGSRSREGDSGTEKSGEERTVRAEGGASDGEALVHVHDGLLNNAMMVERPDDVLTMTISNTGAMFDTGAALLPAMCWGLNKSGVSCDGRQGVGEVVGEPLLLSSSGVCHERERLGSLVSFEGKRVDGAESSGVGEYKDLLMLPMSNNGSDVMLPVLSPQAG